jgi:hypothetical protein
MPQGGADVVLARLDGATGATSWASLLGGVNDEDCDAVAVDAQSNVYVAGTYKYGSAINFECPTPPLPIVDQVNTQWLFVAKLRETIDSDGGVKFPTCVWAKGFANPGLSTSFTATALLPVGDGLIVAGSIGGPTTTSPYSVGGVLFTTSSTFVAKLRNDTGDIAWLVPLAAGSTITVAALSVNSSGGLILAGNYQGGVTLGGTQLPQASHGGAFVALLEETAFTQPDGGGATTARVVAARGYGNSVGFSTAAGVATNSSAVGAEKDTSLFLGQFLVQIDLSPPAGVLASASQSAATPTFLTKLAP